MGFKNIEWRNRVLKELRMNQLPEDTFKDAWNSHFGRKIWNDMQFGKAAKSIMKLIRKQFESVAQGITKIFNRK